MTLTLEALIPLAVFGCVAGGAYAALAFIDPQCCRLRARLAEMDLQGGPGLSRSQRAESQADNSLSRLIDTFTTFLPSGSRDREQLHKRLIAAGRYDESAISAFLAAKILAVLASVAVAAVAMTNWNSPPDRTILVSGLVGGVGAFLPGVWLDRAIKRRQATLGKSLPDFLDLMIVCLDAGLSVQAAIRRVSDELQLAHGAFTGELRILQRDLELGSTVDQALRRFADRCGHEGVRTLAGFVRESQRFGTTLTEALRIHADMLRTQVEYEAEEKVQKAAVKILIPTLLLIFPAVFVVLVGPAIIQIHESLSSP